MAHITFHPSNKYLAEILRVKIDKIETVLHQKLPKLGVSIDDIIIKILETNIVYSSSTHVEIILKTDNPNVTANKLVNMLSGVLSVPFEVSRIPVGNMFIELIFDIKALISKKSRNWDSNYQ